MEENDDTKILEEAKKLPMVQRVDHKMWKIRAEAYDDIKNTCEKVMSSDDPVMAEYGKLLAKSVTDANAPALDKALEALLAFQAKCSIDQAASICDRSCSSMFAKAMNGRPGTVVKATQVFLFFVELEQAEKVVEHVIAKGLEHKVPKVVAASIDVLFQAVSAFGTKVVAPQHILKVLPPLFESRDAKTREKVKATVVELSRWIGADSVKNLLFDKMREAMQGDVAKLIDQAPGGKPKPERLLRSEQIRLEQQAASGSGQPMEEDVVEDEEPELDEFDLSAPAEVLGELKKDWWEALQEKKWTIRKQALTKLKDLASRPRLATGDYGDVLRELKKIITKDSNVQCIAEATNCVGALAKGLRQEFSSPAKSFCAILLEKLKEKNPVVSRAIPEGLTMLHKHCLALQDVAEDAVAALGHANPKVRQQTLEWLKSCAASEGKDALKQVQAQITPVAAKLTDDPTPAIREAALAVLLEFCLKASGIAAIEKITSKLADNRKKKLEDMLQESRQSGKTSGAPPPAASAAAAPPKPATSSRPSAPKKAAVRPPSPASNGGGSEPMAIDGDPPSAPSGPVQKGPPPLSARQPPKSAAPVKQLKLASPDEDDAALSSGTMGKEVCEEQMTALFGGEVVTDLKDPVWKKRMEALDVMIQAAKEMDIVAKAKVIVNGVAHLPGWGEKNFQVMSRQFEMIRLAAEKGDKSFGKSEAFLAIKGMVDKMGDMKLKTPASEALSMICEAVGPQFVFDHMHNKAVSHKNPKVLAETLNWMGKAIQEFGLSVMNTKNLINWIQVDAGSTNPAVRNAAVALAGFMHSFVGPALGEMLQSGVKPAQMTTIQQAFDKNPMVTDFVPSRTPRTGAKIGKAGGKGASKDAAPSAAFDPDELLPRADISSQITSGLMGKLTDSNWKNRKAGLEEVEGILAGAGNRIQPNTGELMSALKGMTKDSNRNLAASAIRLMGKIAAAMGKAIERQGRPVLGPALLCISDTKTLVRAAVIEMLGAWSAAAGVASVMSDVASTAAAPKCSADGKTDLVNWVAGLVNDGKDVQTCLDATARLVAAACMDKISSVKEVGNKLMQLLVDKYGSEVANAAQGIDGPMKKAALEAIQKAGGGGSTSQAPAKAQSSQPGGSGGGIPRPSTATKRPNSSTGHRPAKIPASRLNTAPAPSKEDKMEVDEQPLLQLSEHKEARARKNRGKRAKYDGIPPDEGDTLKSELETLVAPVLKANLFATDFKKQCSAAEMITATVESLYDEAISCLDLLFRWAVMRIVEANTQCLVKTLEMLKALLEAMISRGYRMSEYEAIILMPVLVEKSGHNQDRIKREHRDLMVLATKVLAPSKVFIYLADGLESKNNRTKVECAEEIGAIIDREGMKMASGQKQIKAFPGLAAAVSSRDAAFRKACLSTLEIVYDFEGNKIWKILGRLTDQQRSLVEERLKVRSRQLMKENLTAGFRNEDRSMTPEEPPIPPRASPSREGFGFARRGSPGPGLMSPSPNNGQMLTSSHEGRIPTINNMGGGIPRPMSYSPSPGSAMESTPRAGSPRLTSPVPDPPEMGNVNGIFAPRAVEQRRNDAEIENVWSQAMITMVSGSIEDSINALKVLCFELMEASKGRCSDSILQLMAGSADELVKELLTKMGIVFYGAAAQAVLTRDPPSNRGCKYTLNTLMQVFGIPLMAKAVQKSTLKDTIACLLTLLLDERLPKVHEGAQLMKAMNVLVLQMLEVCNKNWLFSLLLELLRQQPEATAAKPPAIQEKFSNLVIKCLIKMTKAMGNLLMNRQEESELDIKVLVWDIHTYFVELGVDEIRRRGEEEDKPLKMVKTILHEICRHKGTSVVEYVDCIPHDEEPLPIILAYIDLNLQTLHNTGIISGDLPPAFSDNDHVISQYFGSIEAVQSPQHIQHNPPASPSQSLASASASASSMSADGGGHDTMKAELAAIFKKIGDKALSREGMEDLYRFQQEHPAVDVMPYLSNTSDAFQAYIERGLQRIHAKRRNVGQRTPTSTPVSYSAASSGMGDTDAVDDMEVDEVSEGSPRCTTPTPSIPTPPGSIPRPGGIPRPSIDRPVDAFVGDQVRSLRDFRNGNRFGRRD